ncbi:MAG TPA: sulfide/dihydroorotate dehydrogenase-like FAD/NAD-binding protein [Bacteroidota bacterium]|nr:sulfide/dihydroorotate dehydrogenase-like FAD/NAD-binding protein [Bacteroidota bacterium]
MFPIIQKEVLAETISRFVIHAPFIAPKRKPGMFVMLRINEHGERIPITLVDSDPKAGTITLIVQGIGRTTKELLTMNAGESLSDVVGPLGNPTPIVKEKTVACVGGGVGTAELLPITRALREAGNIVHSIVGARNKELVILEKEMGACSDFLYITTDDGSYSKKGFVTDQLKELLDVEKGIEVVYAIGPLPMMKAVSNLTRPYGVKTYVSLNAIMVDGTGMCGGCRVSVGGKMKFACVDGPEFDGHEVDFDEMLMRNRSYLESERTSLQQYEERGHICRLEATL